MGLFLIQYTELNEGLSGTCVYMQLNTLLLTGTHKLDTTLPMFSSDKPKENDYNLSFKHSKAIDYYLLNIYEDDCSIRVSHTHAVRSIEHVQRV